MNIPMLPADATKEQTINSLSLLSRAGAKVSNKLLYAPLQMQDIHELSSILNKLKAVADHVHRIWLASDTTIVNFSHTPRMILSCLEKLYVRVNDLSSPLEFNDYSEAVEDVYLSFCDMLEATLQLA